MSDYAALHPSPISDITLWALGGEFARSTPNDSAFFRRDAPYLLQIDANWEEPSADDANVAWARELYKDAGKFSRGGSYLNFLGFHEEGEDLLKETYGANYERLRRIRARYDSHNLFRFNVRLPR